jgi:hypothetical protein
MEWYKDLNGDNAVCIWCDQVHLPWHKTPGSVNLTNLRHHLRTTGLRLGDNIDNDAGAIAAATDACKGMAVFTAVLLSRQRNTRRGGRNLIRSRMFNKQRGIDICIPWPEYPQRWFALVKEDFVLDLGTHVAPQLNYFLTGEEEMERSPVQEMERSPVQETGPSTIPQLAFRFELRDLLQRI